MSGIGFTPVNDICLDCLKQVQPGTRQEIAWDTENDCRRRCGACMAKIDRTPVSNTSGMNG